jgi:holliday junction DNA helicase RuvA
MFARLNGIVDALLPHAVILDVHGVGYLVTCSSRSLSRMGEPGSTLRLHIETQVREDAINLYGFIEHEERDWFRLLTTVQGVGARVALALLGACSPHDLQLAIAAQDKAMLTRADGVGPKLATRIVTELKDKVPDFNGAPVALPTRKIAGTAAPANQNIEADAVSALVNLGYGRAEAYAAVMRVREDSEGEKTVSDLIKRSLTALAGGVS